MNYASSLLTYIKDGWVSPHDLVLPNMPYVPGLAPFVTVDMQDIDTERYDCGNTVGFRTVRNFSVVIFMINTLKDTGTTEELSLISQIKSLMDNTKIVSGSGELWADIAEVGAPQTLSMSPYRMRPVICKFNYYYRF